MIIIKNTVLPVDILWAYREFKRDEVPAPRIPFLHNYTTEEITRYIGENGIEPIELSVVRDRALLTDGNHRIVAARSLGFSKVPVVITVYFQDVREIFYEHTIKRFRMIDTALEKELKRIFAGINRGLEQSWNNCRADTT